MYLALDRDTNDIILGETSPVRVHEGRYTVQQVRCALQTTLGEYLPRPDVGFLNNDDFERNPDLLDIETRAREIILGTKGVSTVIELSISLANREAEINFTAHTIYGVVYDTVPWGIDN